MAPGEVLAFMTLVTGISATFILRGPLGKALADRIAGRTARAPDADLTGELGRTQDELEAVKHRLAEVEERQDFAERMLSRQAEPGRAGLPARER